MNDYAGYGASLLNRQRKKVRTNWKKEVKLERNRVLDEAIENVKNKMRSAPKEWHRGYFSAITTLEIMKDGNN